MIEDLIAEYDALSRRRKVPKYGWSFVNAPYGINIDLDGYITDILNLGEQISKKRNNVVSVPAQDGRSGTKPLPYFLCDNALHFLGEIDFSKIMNGNEAELEQRSREYFERSKALHMDILGSVPTKFARAICNFFDQEPQYYKARELRPQYGDWKSIYRDNFILYINYESVFCDSVICSAWNEWYTKGEESSTTMISLASGKRVIPQEKHSYIRGFPHQPKLISFREAAFESYNLKKSYNAPLGKDEVYKYTTTLNVLLSESKMSIGNTAVISWAQSGEEGYQDIFSFTYDFNRALSFNEDDIREIVKRISEGESCTYKESKLSPDEHFYVLGITPYKARLFVNFYYKDTFGSLLRNINKHYSDLEIDGLDKNTDVDMILSQTIKSKSPKERGAKNENKYKRGQPSIEEHMEREVKDKNKHKPSSLIRGVTSAIFRGSAYPRSLIAKIEIRIRAEKEVTPLTAAILKAYYLRQKGLDSEFKEVLTVSLNEESKYKPYVLGRLFSLYEQVQEDANPGIKTTIRDRYFYSASATPAKIFSVLGKLSQKYLSKEVQYKGKKIFLKKRIEELSERIGDRYPERLSMMEQGAFQLGYYFENRRRYEKNRYLNSETEESSHE